MTLIRLTFVSFIALAMAACTSPQVEESTVEGTNKIPPNFKGTWQLVRISCANGALGTMADFINANLNNESNGTQLSLTISRVQNQGVVSTVSTGLGTNAAVCSYSVTQQWEKTGHWIEVSSPSAIKTSDTAADVCESKKAKFTTSPVFKYIIPVGELSLESKTGSMHLYRTLGRSEKDLEICQTSDRFVYELKKIGD
tara:strand:+ start:6293 stop:6886 length:594 start_codon:yes stop_codon:yes gene_type:complete